MFKTLHIMNPAAGKGILPDPAELNGEVYITEFKGDAVRFLKDKVSEGGNYRIFAYGGDGTQNEVVNAIMEADASDKVILTTMPTGSGNDFYRVASGLSEVAPCDLIRYNGKYVLNVLNIGFDCAAASSMRDFKNKPLINGSLAYILGVAKEFIKKTPTRMKLTVTNEDGSVEFFEDDYLLCAIGNGKFYGGGFKAAPAADINDGLLDVVLVKNISRMRFLSLIGDYKKGAHINEKTLECNPKLSDALLFRRVRKLTVTGAYRYAADGEIVENESGELTIDVVPSAIRIAPESFVPQDSPVPVLS